MTHRKPTVRWMKLQGVLHVETALGIVNIHTGLRNEKGQDVDNIEILPNADRFAGEKPVVTDLGQDEPLLIQGHTIRLIRVEADEAKKPETNRYWVIEIEQQDGEVETTIKKIVKADSEQEAETKATKILQNYTDGGKVEAGVYYAPAGYPAYKLEGHYEVKSLADLAEKWV